MAVYKVPQDVEAEDKLVGPFGFRQFVYLGIAAGAGFIGYLLAKLSIFLIILPLPIIAFFVLLSLPLRKEQPMETYLLALLRFYLKPKLRLWNPDGTITYVEIVAPKLVEQKLSKDLAGEEATERLDYLARIMDSRGWSAKGSSQPIASLNPSVIAEAASATDVLDEDAALAQSFATKIAVKDQQRREAAVAQMRQASVVQQQAIHAAPQAAPSANPAPADDTGVAVPNFNPYPNAMHQRIIQPMGSQTTAVPPTQAGQPTASPASPAATPAAPADNAMPHVVSPGIMRLANNDDLSISAIAHEAHRLADKNEEVVINLH